MKIENGVLLSITKKDCKDGIFFIAQRLQKYLIIVLKTKPTLLKSIHQTVQK